MFNSIEKFFEPYSSTTKTTFLIHRVLFSLWVFYQCPRQEYEIYQSYNMITSVRNMNKNKGRTKEFYIKTIPLCDKLRQYHCVGSSNLLSGLKFLCTHMFQRHFFCCTLVSNQLDIDVSVCTCIWLNSGVCGNCVVVTWGRKVWSIMY